MIEVDIYPVGWLRAWKHKSLRWEWRYMVGQAKRRNWRAVRSLFNGYLAEHIGCHHSAGTGWTQNQAARRASKICMRVEA